MTILVTGAAGFLGRHIARHLMEQGEKVAACDPRFAIPYVERVGDVVLPHRVEDELGRNLYSQGPIEAILHLGSPVGALGVTKDRGSVAYRIVSAAHAAANLAVDFRCPLLNFSTSEIYGYGGHYAEDSAAVTPARQSPRLAYAVGKLAAEQDLHSDPDLEVTSIRLFNMAGPGQDPGLGFVLPRWADAALDGTPIEVFGDGRQRRSFMHVRDLCSFVDCWLGHAFGDLAGLGQVFNVGNPGNEVTMLELADLVKAMTESESEIVTDLDGREVYMTRDYEEAEGVTKLPVLGRAIELGWRPVLGIDAIIRDVVESRRVRQTL